jgi:hypothetical protein
MTCKIVLSIPDIRKDINSPAAVQVGAQVFKVTGRASELIMTVWVYDTPNLTEPRIDITLEKPGLNVHVSQPGAVNSKRLDLNRLAEG